MSPLELVVQRRPSADGCTLGQLTIDGAHECFTLEDVVRDGPKIPGETAIPAGRYAVAITFSPRFQRMLPLLCDVPNFEGVRIHAGNRASETEGCLLVGQSVAHDSIQSSVLALAALQPKIATALAHDDAVWITLIPAGETG